MASGMRNVATAAGNTTGVADIAAAGIRSLAATELISISGMAVAIPTAQCHADFKTAAVIDRASLPDRRQTAPP
jgi:hypothetical protein